MRTKFARILVAAVAIPFLCTCFGPMDNPSDSNAESFTVDSRAFIKVVGLGPFYLNDTVAFVGGVTSRSVEAARLVKQYKWDYGDDGDFDTIVFQSDTLRVPVSGAGKFTVAVVLRDANGYTSRAETTITVQDRYRPGTEPPKPVTLKAFIAPINPAPYYLDDTVNFAGGISPAAVGPTRKVTAIKWDFGSDGVVDTVVNRTDTIGVPLLRAGTFSVSISLLDSLGDSARAQTIIVVQSKTRADSVFRPEVYLPVNAPNVDSACAFYTQNEYSMRPILLIGRYLTYRNKTESLSLGSFVFEVLKNLTGTFDYRSLTLPYRRNFSGGVYTLGNDSISLRAVFHYGPGIDGHPENDSIHEDLFNPLSYIKSFRIQGTSPYYTYEPGPLWHLATGFSVDVSNPLSPKITLNIAFADIKFSCYREVASRYTMSSEFSDTGSIMFPVYEDILFNYHGIGRIYPFRIGDLGNLVQVDSLKIDMAGSRIATDSLPMTFSVDRGEDTLRTTFDFALAQTMLEQLVRFGTSGGQRKVLGTYAAQSGLSEGTRKFTEIYFSGIYSTALADTAFFFCDPARKLSFGTLCFDTPDAGVSTFTSQRYGYSFVMKQPVVTLVQ